MVTADVVRLYPSILYEAGLKALEQTFNNLTNKKVSTEDLVQMSKFVLKSNYFKFNRNVKQQILWTTKELSLTLLTPVYLWTKWKLVFLRHRKWSLWYVFDIDDAFFTRSHGQEKLDSFFEELNRCNSCLKLTYDSSKKICTSNPQIDTCFCITHRLILIILNFPLFTVRPWRLVGYALTNLTFLNILRVWNLGLK